MAKSRKNTEDKRILEHIYPTIQKQIGVKKGIYIKCVGRFVNKYSQQLHDYAPIERIFWGKNETDDYFRSIDVNQKEILSIIKEMYYYNDPELQACKDEFSICQLMTLRYFLINNDKKNAELSCMYLAFSGKFYASCHYRWFKEFVPKREVMDYVVNYMLSKKFSLITEGSLWGAIKILVNTWMDSYKKIITGKQTTDEEFVYIIHQLYERIYAFLRNIAKPYYDAYEKKLYLNYESDNYDQDNFRITQNNSTVIASIAEKTMTYVTSSSVNIARCHAASSSGVDPLEIKGIFENIMNDNRYLDQLREIIGILLSDFIKNYPNVKDITNSVEFIDYSIKAKPNTKDKDLLRLKNTILEWLNTSSRYRSIRTPATKNNYYRAIMIYIVLTINMANKGD